ncbi:MAG: hypothetical protein HC912_12730 [Saprospiraceae bacterium]|nr:hypothetical protein [Saprospiraceae bacterium]
MERIGQFYKQNNFIHFSPVDYNYNLQAFGLPTVAAQPLVSATSQEKTMFTKPAVQPVLPASHQKVAFPKQLLQWLLLLLGAVGLSVALYFVVKNIYLDRPTEATFDKTEDAEQAKQNEMAHTETSVPQEQITEVDTIRREERPNTNLVAPTTQPKQVPKKEKTISQATTDSRNQIKIIVVGAFDSNENAEKRVAEIQSAGYTPYRFMRNGRRCIGIEYQYQKEEDFVKTLQDIRNKFGKDAWVLNE